MKIGYFVDSYFPKLNGVTVSVDYFTKELRKKGHEVYIFAPKFGDYADTDPFVYRIPAINLISKEPVMFPISLPRKSLRQIVKLDLDLIHAHGNGAFSLMGYQVAKMKGIPFILTFHTVFTKYTHYFLKGKVLKPGMVALGLRAFASLCDGVITPSHKMREELIRYGVKKDVKVIPNFIDPSLFDAQKKGYLHTLCNIPNDNPILLTVGRLGKEKNFEFLIRMFKKLSQNDTKTHFVIVGYGVEKENLMHLIQSMHLEERIHLTDKVEIEDMPKVYKDADIFIFASTTETQGICVLEAAASGLPLIVANDRAYEGMVVEGKNGWYVPLRQKEFANAVKKLLNDSELKHEFAKNSRIIARSQFNPDAITQNLIFYYQETMIAYSAKGKMLREFNKKAIRKFVGITQTVYRFFSV